MTRFVSLRVVFALGDGGFVVRLASNAQITGSDHRLRPQAQTTGSDHRLRPQAQITGAVGGAINDWKGSAAERG
jgi:hypothetical protein